MKAIVIDKKHLTLVSHTNGVVIVEESGCIIDLDFHALASICEIGDLGNIYSIKDSDEIIELRNQVQSLTNELNTRRERISQLNDEIENLKVLNKRDVVIYKNSIAEKNQEIETLKAQTDKDEEERKELYKRIDYFENKLEISRNKATKLERVNDELKVIIEDKNNSIKHLNKVIEEKTNSLIELENVEYELNKCRETNNALTEKLESKTSDLAERTYWFRYYRRAFRTVKEYLKPDEKYGFDSSGYNITNSIDSKFVISFKDRSIASRAFNELRYSVSPRNVLSKYANDIIEYNVGAMNIYFIEGTTPAVVRKFNNENFTITCKDVYSAEIINTLLNCGFPVNDIITSYEQYIVCNIN